MIFVEGLDDLLDVLKQMAPVLVLLSTPSCGGDLRTWLARTEAASMVVQFALARIDWRRSPVLV
jgi:hypothetical protein